jgi:serine/threonine-protein kinase HipA
LLNTTIVLENAAEEFALPLKGKKKQLSRKLWIDYYCREQLGLREKQIQSAVSTWDQLIEASFLSSPKKAQYHEILNERCRRLGIKALGVKDDKRRI